MGIPVDKPKTLLEQWMADSRNQRLDAIAASLPALTPTTIQGRWFKDTTINVDGYIFERCRFDHCTVATELATFSFRNCFMANDCQLYFSGPSLKIARLLLHFLRLQGRVAPLAGETGVFATVNIDGTFTLE
jgi:hypothetical protein